jgi:hydroxyethylthiazole kinase-like uncharacterized protein yjeF
VSGPETDARGDVLVDCLFGSGLTRPLSDDHLALLQRLAAQHHRLIAVDVPSGVESDAGAALNPGLPDNTLTIALGAWKFAHFLMPAAAAMGQVRLVEIGCEPAAGAARAIGQRRFSAPAADAHKYRRGLLAVVGGAMPGAARLACAAAQGAGAGYVRLVAGEGAGAAADLVVDARLPEEALADARINAVLVGPGLGRDEGARSRLGAALACGKPLVLDADALVLLQPGTISAPAIATPHEGELAVLERAFGVDGSGGKAARAAALAMASGMVIVAKGPDSVIAGPGGQVALAHRASSWLSVAGTGDVLAGIIASRLATGAAPFDAACEGVWLHAEAARLAGAAFCASALAARVRDAYAASL